MATWPSGKARVCKTLITGSNPVVASGKSRQAPALFCFQIVTTPPHPPAIGMSGVSQSGFVEEDEAEGFANAVEESGLVRRGGKSKKELFLLTFRLD